jgi:hypothetical protein
MQRFLDTLILLLTIAGILAIASATPALASLCVDNGCWVFFTGCPVDPIVQSTCAQDVPEMPCTGAPAGCKCRQGSAKCMCRAPTM